MTRKKDIQPHSRGKQAAYQKAEEHNFPIRDERKEERHTHANGSNPSQKLLKRTEISLLTEGHLFIRTLKTIKFPVLSLINREIDIETGSQQTASATMFQLSGPDSLVGVAKR